MTTENENLRKMLKSVEAIAVGALATQPHDDDKCKEHLEAALEKIREVLR